MHPSKRVPRSLLLGMLLAATIVGLFTSVQSVIQLRLAGRTDPAIRAFLLNFPVWLFWAALVPVIYQVYRKAPFSPRSRLPLHLGLHLAAAIVLMIVHSTALYWWQLAFSLTDFLVPLWYGALGVSYWRIGLNFGIYAVIVITIAWAESTRRERETELALSRLSAQLADSRLYALRMQLNPHFLFNALNSVAMLVRQGKNDVAIGVVAALGDLLRHLLREPPVMKVTLSEELTFLERYFSVERVRMGDRLRTSVSADPETLLAIVPSLILQPLVENAIKHGIAQSPLGGEIRISARREGDRLVLVVADSGPGLEAGDSTVGFGVGLSNTVQRLEEMYGDSFGFELEDSAPGVRASLSIPFSARLPAMALR